MCVLLRPALNPQSIWESKMRDFRLRLFAPADSFEQRYALRVLFSLCEVKCCRSSVRGRLVGSRNEECLDYS
jgi:hypothetical protein